MENNFGFILENQCVILWYGIGALQYLLFRWLV